LKFFVENSDIVTVAVHVWEADGQVEASYQESDIPKEVKADRVEFTFKRPNYADSNAIMQSSGLNVDGTGGINFLIFQNTVLRSLLKGWNLKNEDGDKVPFTNANINNLIPAIARAAVAGVLDKIKM
jgi:hypothetical protein